jgi:hypothetical protein
MKMAMPWSLCVASAGEVFSQQAGAFGQKLSALRRIQYPAGNVNPRFERGGSAVQSNNLTNSR